MMNGKGLHWNSIHSHMKFGRCVVKSVEDGGRPFWSTMPTTPLFSATSEELDAYLVPKVKEEVHG
jgi:hypothetical protein